MDYRLWRDGFLFRACNGVAERELEGQVSAGRLTQPGGAGTGRSGSHDGFRDLQSPLRKGNWATSVIWGRVHKTDTGDNLNGYGLESVARFARKNYVTGRIELVDKDELLASGQQFRIGAYTIGYTRDFYVVPRIAMGLGANFTTYSMPAALHPYYGQRPVAVMLFLRFKLRDAS